MIDGTENQGQRKDIIQYGNCHPQYKNLDVVPCKAPTMDTSLSSQFYDILHEMYP